MNLNLDANWFGSIATLFAVIVALWVAFRDGKMKRSDYLRQQAESISVWEVFYGLRHNKPIVHISNPSKQPIYDVVISYGVMYGAGETYSKGDEYVTKLLKVPPGNYWSKPPLRHDGGMHVKLGVAITFRDNLGQYWMRDSQGRLIRLKADSFSHHNISLPVNKWENLDLVEPKEKP